MKEIESLSGDGYMKKENQVFSSREIENLFGKLKFEGITRDITARLSLLSIPTERRGSHFQDAIEISEIIDDLMAEDRTDQEVNEIRAVCLLHDIGKSGPAEANEKERAAIVQIYNFSFNKDDYDGLAASQLPLARALQMKVTEGALSAQRAEELLDLVESGVKKQTKKRVETFIRPSTTMRTFWSAHVYWTYDILLEEGIDKNAVDVAASHHLLEGCDPAQIGWANINPDMASLELVDKYQAHCMRLDLADKYQAFRVRSGKSHEEAVQILRKLLESRLGKAHPAFPIYSRVLETISAHKEALDKDLGS